MSTKKEIVVCTRLDDVCLSKLSKLRDTIPLEGARIHLVHCWELKAYSYDFMNVYYPDADQTGELVNSIKSVLNDQKGTILGEGNNSSEFVTTVLQSTSPKYELLQYIKKVNADLTVTVTPEKHGVSGLFHSSFTDYLAIHSPTDILVIRE
jgi:nucleotide-binding universal stress UspA family protein